MKQIEDKNKIIGLLEQMVADKDKQNAWLSKSCDALADEVRRLEVQIGMLKAQKRSMDGKVAKHATQKEKLKTPPSRISRRWGFMKKHKPKK